MSKQPISAKITLNHFQLPGFKATMKQASSVDKRLSHAFIKNLDQPSHTDVIMLGCCFHLKYMIIVKVCLRMVLFCIMVSNPIFSIDSNKWQIELKYYHQLLYWLNLVQCLEGTLILVLLENLPDDFSIISKNCLVATQVLISFATGISKIVWNIWLETNEVIALRCYFMMTHY